MNAGKPDAAQPGLGALRPTLVLALGTFAVGTDAFIVSAFLPRMAEGLGVTPAMAGLSVTVFALAYALLAPVIAALTATVGRRRLLVASLLAMGLSNLASALCTTLPMLLATRVAAAASASAYTPNAGAVAAALVPAGQRARALAVVIGGLTLATALGVPLGHVVSVAISWRASLAGVGIVSFVVALGVLAVMPPLAGAAPVRLRERLSVLKRPGVMSVLPLTVLGMAACYAPYAFTLQVLEALRMPASALTSMLFAYGLGAFAGNYVSGWATDRHGPLAVMRGAYVVMALAMGCLAVLAGAGEPGAPFLGVAFLMAAWGASSWAQTPAQQHRLIAAAPHEVPLVVSLNASGIYLGISLGTAMGSQALGHGDSAPLWVGCALAVIALCYVVVTGAARSGAVAR